MAPLNDDIILLVSEHMDDQRDGLRLLQVCRRWYSLLLPRVYKRISLFNQQIYLLARSIKANPKIGAAIRDLDLHWWSGPLRTKHYDLDMFMETIQQTSHSKPDRQRWENALRQGCPDAWLAVLVLSLESVTTLCMLFPGWSPYFIPLVTQIAAQKEPFDSHPVLQNLETVTAWSEEDEFFYHEIDFRAFFYLPAMKELSVQHILAAEVQRSFSIAPALGTSGIRKIQLEGMAEGGKGNQIASCANLEIFDYHHSQHPIWGSLAPGIYEALTTQRHSLQVLRLRDSHELPSILWNEEFEPFELPGPAEFGSLAEFSQLRELRIPVFLLLRFDFNILPRVSLPEVLPSSLQHLNLTHCFEYAFTIVAKNLELLLAQQKERFPNLGNLEVQSNDFVLVPEASSAHPANQLVPASTPQAFVPVEMLCRRLGIQFKLSNLS